MSSLVARSPRLRTVLLALSLSVKYFVANAAAIHLNLLHTQRLVTVSLSDYDSESNLTRKPGPAAAVALAGFSGTQPEGHSVAGFSGTQPEGHSVSGQCMPQVV